MEISNHVENRQIDCFAECSVIFGTCFLFLLLDCLSDLAVQFLHFARLALFAGRAGLAIIEIKKIASLKSAREEVRRGLFHGFAEDL